jgi:O-antigen biosynthesis protein
VGGKLITTNGRLQEAGNILWRDGGILAYQRDASQLVPEANFVRDVDFCSTAFLLVRTAVLKQLAGFDEEFAGTVYQDADLCVRIAEAGCRVIYDPAVVVRYHARIEQRYSRDVADDPAAIQRIFARKHINYLRFRYIADPRVQAFARSTLVRQRRLLFIEDTVPLRWIGSGFVRSCDLIGVLASMDFFVTVFPVNGDRFDLAATYAELPDTVEVLHDRQLADLDSLLAERQGYYDVIWVARTHNLDRAAEALLRNTAGTGRPPRIVLDTEAIAAIREAGRRRLTDPDGAFDLNKAIADEFAKAQICQNIVAVSDYEAAKLRELGFADVAVIGHMRELHPTSRGFDDRAGLLFVGAIHEAASPNYDALCWFVDEVLPLVEAELAWETRLTVVGYTAEHVSLERFRGHARVTLRGMVADTEPLYAAHRLFVAPARFAAGAPYKVYEAASFGLPVVATELLREQLGWEDGRELLAADHTDPAGFARKIVTLYRDAELWQRLRDSALARLAAENSRKRYVTALTGLLGD